MRININKNTKSNILYIREIKVKNKIDNKASKKKKSVLTIFTRIFIVFSVIGIIAWIALFTLNYKIGDENIDTAAADGNSSQKQQTVSKKKVLNVLFCGENQNLTDTMMYVKYDVETGKVWIMSIPRDTYVTSPYAPGGLGGHKLNCIYTSKKNSSELLRLVKDITGVDMDYYVVVSNEIVRELVDEIGGVEINVPMRMKYDDLSQNLHINLQPGTQVLNGEKAEEFIRFRHNNDGTGYAQGDIQRTEAQQQFVKAFASTLLSAKNITKIPDLINIITKNTDTNMTIREALKYVTDMSKIKTDQIVAMTAPGETKGIKETGKVDNGQTLTLDISYFVIDKEKTQEIIQNQFTEAYDSTSQENSTTNNTTTSNENGL